MARHFDPVSRRARILEALGHFTKPQSPREASYDVDDALYAVLCGLSNEARHLLQAAMPALKESALSPRRQREETNEPLWYWLYGAEADRLCHLGLAEWILTGTLPRNLFQEAAAAAEKSIQARNFPHADEMELDAYMVASVLAHRDADALAFYELEERDGTNLMAPASTRSERRLCQAICLHRVKGLYTRQELQKAGDALLKRRTDTWLTDGATHRLAQWLIVRFHDLDEGGAPEETLLRAYRYLAGVQPPAA